MIRVLLYRKLELLGGLKPFIKHMHESAEKLGSDTQINSAEIQTLQSNLRQVASLCADYELHQTIKIVGDLELNLFVPTLADHTYRAIEIQLGEIQKSIYRELQEKTFAFIPSEKAKFFEKDGDTDAAEALFGRKVYQKFPSARQDIKDAGKCLAADLHTAAAFHLMRVFEIGLRELAQDMAIVFYQTPLDYSGWKAVVDAITKKLSDTTPKARGPEQEAALKFKHDLIADFNAFEVVRNEIMHVRRPYNEADAIALFGRAREFMQRLASHDEHGKQQARPDAV
jgi:hypothetical protein